MAATKRAVADGGEHADTVHPAKKAKKDANSENDAAPPRSEGRTKEQIKLELRRKRKEMKKLKKERKHTKKEELKAKRRAERALETGQPIEPVVPAKKVPKQVKYEKEKLKRQAKSKNAFVVPGSLEEPTKKTKEKSKPQEVSAASQEALVAPNARNAGDIPSTTETPDTNETPEIVTEEPKRKKKKEKRKPLDASPASHDAVVAPDMPDTTDIPDILEASNGAGIPHTTDSPDVPKKSKKKNKTLESTGSKRKRTYRENDELHALPKGDIEAFLTKHSITVTDVDAAARQLRPIIKFEYLPSTDLLAKKPFKSYKLPTPIQAASWPYTLSGRDVIGVAETGSGKTMAFALPCVESVLRMGGKGVKAVIVSPTRELAMQTHAQLEVLAGLVGLSCVCIYGGASKATQRAELERGVDIITATPGRLKDFMSDGTVELTGAHFAVLDEADRMLDTGFEQDIKDILSSAPPRGERQTMMFTATWPASVQALAASFMVNPVKVTIGSGGKETVNGAVELQANTRITQRVEVVDHNNKERRLLEILKQRQQGAARNDRILVFCLYKKEASRVETFLRQRGIRVGSIHGDLRQEQRTKSLEAFKSGQTPVLVATDVAARGLDIPEVKLVVNVTFPLTIEDYVHRIGRTGRAGKDGEAITMFTEGDKAHSGSLINILKGANQPVPDELLKFGTTVKKKEHGTYGAFFKDVDMTKTATKITFDD